MTASHEPLAVQSVTDRVYLELRERILAGALEPDERLHQEAISAELGVSRTPVREALGRLASDGLVELLPNRGARVAETSAEDMAASYDARRVIEPAAARLAAQHRGPAAIAAMRAAIESHRGAAAVPRAAFAGNRDFHLAMLRCSGNPFLQRFGESLWVTRLGLRVYVEQRETPEMIARDADEHEAICDAIEAGDAAAAEAACAAHIARARELLYAALRETA